METKTTEMKYNSYKEYKESTNTEPQIILSNEGIQTSSTKFYKWGKIQNEEARVEGSGKHISHYLYYDHPKGIEYLEIDDFDTDQQELNKLLLVYRGRHKKAKKKQKEKDFR